MKKLESLNLRKELRHEISKFMDILNEYWEADEVDKEDTRCLICRELKQSSPFAAFKRWIIRDNRDRLSEFLQEDGMKVSY